MERALAARGYVATWGAMPRLFDPIARSQQVAAAVNHIITARGIPGLTMRGIGEVARISPSSLLGHYRSRWYMLKIAAHVTGSARLEQIRWRIAQGHGLGAWLPDDDEDVLTARAWLGWCELWRTHEWITYTVGEIRAHEVDEIARLYDHRLTREELDLVVAMIDGLLVAICRPERPMSRPAAQRVLARATAHLTPDGDEADAG